jgi:hypothetical protein
MKIISIYRLDPQRMQEPPSQETIEKMGALITELQTEGVMVDTGGVIPNGMMSRVRHNGNGSFSVMDGPFTETKEVIGGFAVFDVSSRDEAIRLTERFLSLAGPGVCELIEVGGPPE